MVRRQNERTARLAFTDATKRANWMDMCPSEDRHYMLNSDRFDTCPMDVSDMAWPEDLGDEGECEDVHAFGYAKGTAKGKGKGKDAQAPGKAQEKNGKSPSGNVQEELLGAKERPVSSDTSATNVAKKGPQGSSVWEAEE